ncbi:hypothetical protein ACIBCN_37650 [Nocardia sp. NPDC051052]|uniref:hypothetical protein n=1 Tax=Nocardia sp. NPDC051052 TaxID=3364322 RepID=UPI0037B0C0F4
MSRDAAAQIRALFADSVARGFDPRTVVGADDAEIDAMARAQRVPAVPVAVREVLRLMGRELGRYESLGGSGRRRLGVSAIYPEDRKRAENFAEYDSSLTDPGHLLVLSVLELDEGWFYEVVDGSQVTEPDPPVWFGSSDGFLAAPNYPSVTVWFAAMCAEVEGMLAEEIDR